MGTVYYSGITKKNINGKDVYYYTYKNSLDKLRRITETVAFKAKTKSGYILTRGIYDTYRLCDFVKEENLKVQNTDIGLNMIYLGYIDGKKITDFIPVKAQKTDTLYKKTENKNEINSYKELEIRIDKLCIVSGSYQGNINITFDVGTKHNGKECKVIYYNDLAKEDYYTEIVKDGKVTITVNTSNINKANDKIIIEGDINGDGKINTKDAREALLAYIGKTKLTEEQRAAADVNKDGKINSKDARQILLYYIGKINKF